MSTYPQISFGEPPCSFMLKLHGSDLPELVLPNHAYGMTEYLDRLRPGDLSGPVMRGTDRHGRPFVAVRMRLTHRVLHTNFHKEKVGVECFFKRDANPTHGVWTSGGSPNFVASAMTLDDCDNLRCLLEKRHVYIVTLGYYLQQLGEIKLYELV